MMNSHNSNALGRIQRCTTNQVQPVLEKQSFHTSACSMHGVGDGWRVVVGGSTAIATQATLTDLVLVQRRAEH